MMKSVSTMLFLLLVGVVVAPAASTRTYTGQIMDSACAKAGNHHAGYKMTGMHTPRGCTLACVKAGSHFVLYNSARHHAYRIDNVADGRRFAGENVKIVGKYNSHTKILHVISIRRVR